MNLTIQINIFNKKCVFLPKILYFFVDYLLNFVSNFLFGKLYNQLHHITFNPK